MRDHRKLNLNELPIAHDMFPEGAKLENGARPHERVQCYFRDIRQHLIRHIDRCDYVFGCVAWLTDREILAALAKKKGVCLLVQKEDFLRPDATSRSDFAQRLRRDYTALRRVERRSFHGCGIAAMLSFASGVETDAVRCVGTTKGGMFKPRMHHKFALFANENTDPECPWTWDRPHEVWTGSYNWSETAGRSFENAVVTQEFKTVKAFYIEFQQLLGLSEPCDWTSEWVAPEWRIGT